MQSTGNSLTLRDSLVKFGADATRITLADAGDGFDDANFEELTANATILRLYTFAEWAKVRLLRLDVHLSAHLMRATQDIVNERTPMRRGEYTLFDKIFEAEIIAGIAKSRDAFEQ